MIFYERFLERCKDVGIAPTTVVMKALGNKGILSQWKRGSTPTGRTLTRLAAELNCTVDDLLGNAEEEKNENENLKGVEIMQNNDETIIDGSDENNRFGTWVKAKRESMGMSEQDFAKKIDAYWDADNVKLLESGQLKNFVAPYLSKLRPIELKNIRKIVESFNKLNVGPVDYYQTLLLIEQDGYMSPGGQPVQGEYRASFKVFDKIEIDTIWNNIIDVFAKRKESYEPYFTQALGDTAISIIKDKGYISLSKIYEIARNANIDAYDILPVARGKERSESAFIAMWFVPPEEKGEDKNVKKDRKRMEKTESTLRQAIEDRGFIPSIVNDNKHDNNLYNEIIARIKACKFMVADLTGNRQSVYFEIGFAHGLGKPVIQTCHKDYFDDVAFDLKQIYTIIWDEEKIEKLKEDVTFNIAATIAGARPLDLPAVETPLGTVTTNQLAEMLITMDKKMATKDDIAALDKRIRKLEETSKAHADQIEDLDGEEEKTAGSSNE
jgi:transcriptional regulator with XRE-family HTH domain/nucleoside 2-deoxyribosyltransferase